MKYLFTTFSLLTLFNLFPTMAFAEDTLCFMQWRGKFIDLSSTLCNTKKVIDENFQSKSNTLSSTDIRFSGVAIEPSPDGKYFRVRGNIINESQKTGSLSGVRFNLINQKNGRIITSGIATVETGSGIAPGEQIGFTQVINRNSLRGNAGIGDLIVQITATN